MESRMVSPVHRGIQMCGGSVMPVFFKHARFHNHLFYSELIQSSKVFSKLGYWTFDIL
jgi:hypothetical protein